MYLKDHNNLKALIVGLLGEKYPLWPSDIKTILTRTHKQRFTRQAIHKSLNHLIAEKVVVRNNHNYQLDPQYILELANYVNVLKSRYFQPFRQSFYVEKNDHLTFNPATIADLDILWNKILREKLAENRPDRPRFFQHFPHAWFNLVHMDEEIKIVQELVDQCSAFYTLVNGYSLLDKWMGKFYNGKKMRYAMKEQPDFREKGHCFGVLHPYVIETRYPKSIATRLDNLFNGSANIQELNVAELVALANAPIDLTLTLHNNPELALKYRRAIVKYF